MTVANKPSGSFVLWQNTLCNPLADPMVMTHSAWHDGYASAKAEPEQQPVAWMVYTLDGKSVCVTDNPNDFGPENKALPLYTAPTPQPEQPHDLLCVCGAEWDIYSDGREELVAAPTPRKPLTDEEIALIVGECAASAHQHDDFSFARAIERAHGIGEQHE